MLTFFKLWGDGLNTVPYTPNLYHRYNFAIEYLQSVPSVVERSLSRFHFMARQSLYKEHLIIIKSSKLGNLTQLTTRASHG